MQSTLRLFWVYKKNNMNFIFIEQFSDDEEETKRIVRSTKEKRYEEIEGIIHSLRNHRKIKDFSSALASFEDLQKAYTRAAPVVQKEESGIAPRFFIRALVELEDWVSGAWTDRDSRRTLSKGTSKALTSLRQKLRKYTKEFDAEVSKFRENPDLPDDDDEKKGKGMVFILWYSIIFCIDCIFIFYWTDASFEHYYKINSFFQF